MNVQPSDFLCDTYILSFFLFILSTTVLSIFYRVGEQSWHAHTNSNSESGLVFKKRKIMYINRIIISNSRSRKQSRFACAKHRRSEVPSSLDSLEFCNVE